ncbi:MAG: hypothetical protein KDD34_09840, partial [Bdellovibrionales bacterium]|nr:hypothetical protein [Bdellovibrionales bacterium]
MINKGQPLVEVFGFSTDDFSKIAISHRDGCLCPYNNGVPKCTKDKKDSPLGVCTLNHNGVPTIICPIRFREDWRILKDATEFFFKGVKKTRALKEVRLKMKNGQSAGNIDVVLVSHDELGRVIDFGAIEIQAVYVSGNIRNPFEAYMKNPQKNYKMDWTSEAHYPRADFLSSSRKRLVPQLMYKGRILQDWKKKQAVVI